jgi:adenine/guanine/hypoxanthine permease
VIFCGILKAAAAPFSYLVRQIVPRAGLLGSLAAIAIVLISFLPLVDMMRYPLVALVSLSLLLTSLVGHVKLPFNLPGALGTLLVAGGLFYLLRFLGIENYQANIHSEVELLLWPTQWLAAFEFAWVSDFQAALPYLPVVIPFGLATVIGGIDCTESAATVGDEYSTGQIVFGEAMATLLAGLAGAVIQTTPYIGHPAYKTMGGRSAYVLATALAIGIAGVSGAFTFFYQWIPQPAVYPILIFIGLEIAAQSFLATPRKHYSAIAFACVPALAFLAGNFPDQMFGDQALRNHNIGWEQIAGEDLKHKLPILRMLSAGFILTSLLWASLLAAIIDHRLKRAAAFLAVCALATLVGFIHSPLPGSPLGVPFAISGAWGQFSLPARWHSVVLEYVIGYGLAAVFLIGWDVWRARYSKNPIEDQPTSDPKMPGTSQGAV